MGSGPIILCQINGEKVETVTDSIFLGSKVNVDGDCSHEIKRHLLLGRKAMTNIDSVLKNKNKSISSLAFSLLYGPTLTSAHDYWKKHGFDYMDLCRQSYVSAF